MTKHSKKTYISKKIKKKEVKNLHKKKFTPKKKEKNLYNLHRLK